MIFRQLLATKVVDSFYPICNTRGDLKEIRNAAGQVIARYNYDAWGKITSITDKNGAAVTSDHFANQISVRYRGYVYDYETGLYYLQSRYYDPEVGRFLNADDAEYIVIMSIVRNVSNLYSYCWNNPVLYEDVTGNLAWPGQIHSQVVNRIVAKNPRLSSEVRIYYEDGGYGNCDIIHFNRKLIWEVKRCTVSFKKAYEQLTRYVNGYYQQKNPPKRIDGFNYGTDILGDGNFDDFKNYYVWYWYEGSGIIYYDYYKLSTQKAFYPATSPSTETATNALFLTAILFMLGILSSFGGRSNKYA